MKAQQTKTIFFKPCAVAADIGGVIVSFCFEKHDLFHWHVRERMGNSHMRKWFNDVLSIHRNTAAPPPQTQPWRKKENMLNLVFHYEDKNISLTLKLKNQAVYSWTNNLGRGSCITHQPWHHLQIKHFLCQGRNLQGFAIFRRCIFTIWHWCVTAFIDPERMGNSRAGKNWFV